MAYALDGVDAEGIQADPNLKIVASKHASIQWIEFTEQWDPKSPWHDKRLRLAVNYALDRAGISKAACLGFCPPAGVIVPRVMEYALQTEPMPYDPQKARQLLAEAGYPNGIDAGNIPHHSIGDHCHHTTVTGQSDEHVAHDGGLDVFLGRDHEDVAGGRMLQCGIGRQVVTRPRTDRVGRSTEAGGS